MKRRHKNGGLRKVCECPHRTWAKCDHPWHFAFKYRGRHHRFSLDRHLGRHVASKTEAQAEADRLRSAIRAGTFGSNAPVREGLSLGQLLDTYKSEVLDARPGGAAAHDVSRLKGVRRQVLRLPTGEHRTFEDWRVSDVTAGALELLRAAMLPQGRIRHANKRVTRVGGMVAANRGLRCLRTVFNWAVRVGYVDASPFKRGTETIVKLTREAKRTRRLHEGEDDRLLPTCGPHLWAVTEAALETGMRKGEILSLQWADVQLAKGEIRLTPTKTKTRTGRTIPISARLRAILEMRRLDPAGEEHPATAYVFGNEIGQRVGDIKTAWKAACRRAKIVDLHFHDLRREAGSRWLEGGVALHTIKDWLGHTSVAQTSTYLASALHTGHEAMRRFDERRSALQELATKGETGVHTGAQQSSEPANVPQVSAVEHVSH